MTPIHARLTKLSTLPGATIDPFGAREAGPITDGYYVLGHFDEYPTTGRSFTMTRYNSNGVEAHGVYTTSPVDAFELFKDNTITFRTANSTYHLTSIL